MPAAANGPYSSSRVGTAEWADPQTMEENCAYRPGSIWLGRSLTQNQLPLGYRDDRHVCLVSGTRGGKGTTSIIPTLCEWPGSTVVVDPKGENATITAARRGSGSANAKGLDQKVCVLDPFKAAKIPDAYRARFNPLDVLKPGDGASVDEAGRIADALVVITDDSKDPFWDESARQLVKGLILHVLTASEYAGKRNLITVRELITRGDWQSVRALEEMGEQNISSAHALLMEAVRRNNAFYGVVTGIGESFRSMILNSPKQFESVVQVANRNTEFIDSPGMRDCLSGSTFKLAELKTLRNGLSLYLSLPQRYMGTHFRWLRMMISLTLTEMEIVPGRPASGCPVLMLLDEFAGLQRMKIIEDGVAQLAGFGVKLFFVLQSLEQLKRVYKDGWETFLSNSGLKMFFSIDDHFSREYISKLIGDTELIRELHTSNQGTTTGESWSKGSTWSNTVGTSQGGNRGRSGGTSRSVSDSTSGGSSQSVSNSAGGSTSESYKRPGWLGLKIRGLFGLGRNKSEDNISDGRNWSTSQTTGTNKGWSRSNTAGTNAGWSDGQNWGSNESRSSGGSDGYSRNTGATESRGVNESLHKRALINPDEIGRAFTRIDDRRNPDYPGLALVLMTGAPAAVVQKVNYYEDAHFLKHFDPHPDHSLLLAEPCEIRGAFTHMRLLQLVSRNLQVRWLVSGAECVRQGQPIAEIIGRPINLFAKKLPVHAYIRAPYDGSITKIRMRGVDKFSFLQARSLWKGDGGNFLRNDKGVMTVVAYQRLGKGVTDPYVELEALLAVYMAGLKKRVIKSWIAGVLFWTAALALPFHYGEFLGVFGIIGTIAVIRAVIATVLLTAFGPSKRVAWRHWEDVTRMQKVIGSKEDVRGWDRELMAG